MDSYYSNNYEQMDSDWADNSHIVWNARTVILLIGFIAIPLIVGGISSLLTRNAMMEFNMMVKPPLAPPAWLFPVVWSVLYVLMGIACFLIYESSDESRYAGLVLFSMQLVMNFFWSLIFFRLDAYVLAAAWLALMILLIVALIINTSRYSIPAMIMLIPYGLWCGFAMYLNVGIAALN